MGRKPPDAGLHIDESLAENSEADGIQNSPSPSRDETGPRTEDSTEPSEEQLHQTFPIVGIGASAGGLEAFEKFFTNMPPDSGMAFVLVQHLDPTHKSILGDLITRYTRMKVVLVEDGVQISPNWIYIIPPDRDMAILGGRLHLMTPGAPRGQRHPINFFFRSLAQDRRNRAIAIVLSGTGTDGTQGIRAIKGEAGTVLVEEPETAKYDGMPRSAIATGVADFVLPAEKMPAQLMAFARQAFSRRSGPVLTARPQALGDIEKVLVLLRAHTGHDFSYYKNTTIIRRIERRMAVNQIETIGGYVRHIRQHPAEADTLFKELLIGVTNFFRDAQAFASLEKNVIRPLIEKSSDRTPIRVWVPGCSTGEEAYSIAILFRESMDALGVNRKVQIFATDIDPSAVEWARAANYPESVAADVPPQTLRRFFRREGSNYEIDRSIRDMIVFALQSVIKDPPFSKIDLISCRNLLIYLKAELQKTILPLFHYSLREDGYLFLGSSETIGEFGDLFGELDRRWKIFERKGDGSLRHRALDAYLHSFLVSQDDRMTQLDDRSKNERWTSLKDLTKEILLNDYAPTCIIINEKCEILYTRGHTGRYLELASGEVSLSILKMARPGLHLELNNAIRKSLANKERIRVENLRVKFDDAARMITITVQPVTDPPAMQGLTAVIIEDAGVADIPRQPTTPVSKKGDKGRIDSLEKELQSTKEYLQSTIEQLETSNEELTSTNEELQSSNEELQSTNQELQTSKEELQSMNEELATVNSELETKIDALSKANDDINNLMSSTRIAIIFLDVNLCIQRFTATVTDIINLIDADIGRPLEHIAHNLEYRDLVADARTVLADLVEAEKEVEANNGRWYLTKVRPYRTNDNVIDGVVITFTDITEQKLEQEKLRAVLKVSEETQDSVIITDEQGIIEYVNPYFCEVSGFSTDEAVGNSVSIVRSEKTDPGVFRDMWQVIKKGGIWRGDIVNQRKDSTLYLDQVTIWPILDKDGAISRFVAVQKCLENNPDLAWETEEKPSAQKT